MGSANGSDIKTNLELIDVDYILFSTAGGWLRAADYKERARRPTKSTDLQLFATVNVTPDLLIQKNVFLRQIH